MDTTTPVAAEEEVWSRKYYEEYVNESPFVEMQGMDANAIIQVNEELGTRPGNKINFSLLESIRDAAIVDDDTLEGNEAALSHYVDQIEVHQYRQGVRVGKMAQYKTSLDYLKAAKPMLKNWDIDHARAQAIDCLLSPNLDGVTPYALSTEAQKDAWLGYNTGRIQFGALASNTSGTDHSASLLNIDNTADKFTLSLAKMIKRRAVRLGASGTPRRMRPTRTDNGTKWYTFLLHSYQFRDLMDDTDVKSNLQYAYERGKSNPLVQAGDIAMAGMIFKEIEEFNTLTGVGNGGIDCACAVLLGAQALGLAVGEQPSFETETRDYKNKKGVSIATVRRYKKLTWNNVQNGVFSVYTAAVGDS